MSAKTLYVEQRLLSREFKERPTFIEGSFFTFYTLIIETKIDRESENTGKFTLLICFSIIFLTMLKVSN